MQFSASAPGLLVPSGGGYLGTWDLGSVSGISAGAASSWINASLNNSLGWGRAGVSFSEVGSGGAVTFSVVPTIAYGGPNTLGYATHDSAGHAEIVLEAAYVGMADLVNHEAAHAFFYAEHSPNGTDSLLEPIEDPGTEWPSASDIAQVRAWLGNGPAAPPDDVEVAEAETYWFPADLETYITKWNVPAGARARMTATVIDPAPALIKPVFATSHEDLLAGSYERFCRGLGTDEAGDLHTEWQGARGSGDIYVGIVVDVEAGYTLDDLNVGLCEVQISGSGDDSSRSIAN